ncbi:DUF2332 domain-containing protein [Terrabacter sp. BE26]|uniref:DUF2332 domain-containing protein n=1 Tax=Terrabacter sp. BE26 TaxID=2898152 RepID=UPI0035BE3C50
MPAGADRAPSRHEDGETDAERLERVRRRFREFGSEYASLPLYGAVSRSVAEDPTTAELLVAAQPGQARPVLWFAALHDLVLRQPDLRAARWYASVVGRDSLPQGDPWPDVRATVLEHADELRHLIASRTTQTNEVNRSVYLAATLAAAGRVGRESSAAPASALGPVALVELGASAGLLLGLDRYLVTAMTTDGIRTSVGDAASPVRCEGLDRSAGHPALGPLPPVLGRAGVDREPVDLEDEDAVRWLLACLWPDVPGRVERFRAARQLMRSRRPPLVLQGDLVDDVAAGVDAARQQARGAGGVDHVIVYSSWALTYVERDRRAALAQKLAGVAETVPRLSWLTAEPPDCVPGLPDDPRTEGAPTVLGLRTWTAGAEAAPRLVGTAHPHGAWVDIW